MVHPDDRARVEAQSGGFLAGEGADLDDYRMVRSDGRVVWVRDRAFAERDERGKALYEHGILFDVTELKDAEAGRAPGVPRRAPRASRTVRLFEETLILAIERAKRTTRRWRSSSWIWTTSSS